MKNIKKKIYKFYILHLSFAQNLVTEEMIHYFFQMTYIHHYYFARELKGRATNFTITIAVLTTFYLCYFNTFCMQLWDKKIIIKLLLGSLNNFFLLNKIKNFNYEEAIKINLNT